MKKTFREKLMSRCRRAAKKHKWLRIPVMVYMAIALFWYYAGLYVVSNGKRFSCVALFFLFLFVNSSFASPESLIFPVSKT